MNFGLKPTLRMVQAVVYQGKAPVALDHDGNLLVEAHEVFPDAPGERQEFWQEKIPGSRRGPEALCAESETLHLVDAMLRQMSPLLHHGFALGDTSLRASNTT